MSDSLPQALFNGAVNLPRELIIEGQARLSGKIQVAGAKNAVLPIMAASLLTDQKMIVENIPHLDDVALMAQVLCGLGVTPIYLPRISLELGGNVKSYSVPFHQAIQMRSSILILGPMLTRYGRVELPFPGGCAIGERPIDLHVKALAQLGADFDLNNERIVATAPNGLTGTKIHFDVATVGGTENVLMAASLAKGNTLITNASKEPEVEDLANFLTKAGVKIDGIGTDRLEIQGTTSLKGCSHSIIPDRIEAGTYLVAAAATRSSIELCEVYPHHLTAVLDKLREAGAKIEIDDNSIKLDMQGRRPRAVDIQTSQYPGFPTDMQAQFTAMNAVAEGDSQITENIFPDRNAHIEEMQRMKAKIVQEGNSVKVSGIESLTGTDVVASDLRASACLVIAGLIATGKTRINNIYHIDRGYEWLNEKLEKLGANVKSEVDHTRLPDA